MNKYGNLPEGLVVLGDLAIPGGLEFPDDKMKRPSQFFIVEQGKASKHNIMYS